MSKDTTGVSKIDPGLKSITFEMQLFVPTIANSNQIICQKLSGSLEGITIALSSSASTSNCDILFMAATSGSFLSASCQIEKGKFQSISAQFNRSPGIDKLYIYVDSVLATSSSNSAYFGQIDFKKSNLLIGTGSQHSIGTYTFQPANKLSGSIDDFRVYHSIRSSTEISSSMLTSDYANDNLRLLFKFNESTGSYSNNYRVIDHSGNGLHSTVSSYSQSQRVKHVSSPLVFENSYYSPVLFPDNSDVATLNSSLLLSASDYDMNNPNLITKLIPKHYLTREQDFYILDSEQGEVGESISSGNSTPRDTKLGSIQLISSLLYTWAKHFDEMKCFADQFSLLKSPGLEETGNAADQMLPFMANYYGVELPNIFKNAPAKRFILGESDNVNVENDVVTMQKVQNIVWRRILHELPVIMKSRGTTHAIKSLIRAAGIEPDRILKFKEYGGTKEGYIYSNRSKRSIVVGELNFSGSLFEGAVNYDATTGIPDSLPFIMTPYLSASRVEPGLPTASGLQNDGLFTSGSWSFEAFYKFDKSVVHPKTQSLARLHMTGTSSPSNNHAVIMNLIATKGYSSSSLDLHISTDTDPNSYAVVNISDVDIFNGEKWLVSFGRDRNENALSSSYYLWASRQQQDAQDFVSASSHYDDKSTSIDTLSSYNTSGSFICIGPQSIYEGGTKFLNNPSRPTDSRESMFTGKVSSIRFWTKLLTLNELLEHTQNLESVGVENPTTNYNFVTNMSGSWERLRIDASCVQEVTSSNMAGAISIFDYSQNDFHISGSGFGPNQMAIIKDRADSSVISMQFDEAQTDNKIRVRGYQEYNNTLQENSEISPVYETRRSETPIDDLRYSIEVSPSRVLDEDIAKIFATLDEIDNAVGNPELQFSVDYPRLETLRDVYFNRLTEKIKIKQLYEFFKWFDVSMASLIEKFIPSNTRFLGVNYVIEPHALERAKFYYHQSGIYLGENERRGLKGTLKLGQVTARIRRI